VLTAAGRRRKLESKKINSARKRETTRTHCPWESEMNSKMRTCQALRRSWIVRKSQNRKSRKLRGAFRTEMTKMATAVFSLEYGGKDGDSGEDVIPDNREGDEGQGRKVDEEAEDMIEDGDGGKDGEMINR
jgi:hypothetical protein